MSGMKLIGLDAMIKKAAEMSRVVDSEEMERRIVAAAKLIGDEAIRRAPRGETGNLKNSIVAKSFKKSRPGKPAAFVGIDYSVGPHAHLVEFGHAGPQPAPQHPFFRPSWDAKKGAAKIMIETGTLELIDQEANK